MMQHHLNSKRWKFLLACASLAAMVLLAMGLQNVNFKPSQLFVFGGQQENGYGLPPALLSLDQALIVITILFFFFIAMVLVSRDARMWILIVLTILSVIVLIHYFAPQYQNPLVQQNPNRPQVLETPLSPAINLTPQAPQQPAEFHPPKISNLILYLVSFVLTLALIFMAWMIYRWRQSQPSAETLPSLEEIGEAARLALDDLAAGLDGKDAIIVCYARMSGVVMQRRSMERGESRTAAEFATRLESAGLPGTSVRRLTRLFESARYGRRESQPVEIEEAKACLADIARFCGETV